MTGRRWLQLFASCLVLAVGVVLLLRASFGPDGCSTFVNGDFALVNTVVGVLLVALTRFRGTAAHSSLLATVGRGESLSPSRGRLPLVHD